MSIVSCVLLLVYFIFFAFLFRKAPEVIGSLGDEKAQALDKVRGCSLRNKSSDYSSALF